MEQQAVAATKFPTGRAMSFLLSDDWVEITGGELVDLAEFDLGVCFQCGLATITRDGEILSATSEVEVQVKRDGGEWSSAFKGAWALDSLDTYEDEIKVPSEGMVLIRARKSAQSGHDVRDDVSLKARRQVVG
ncbi:hypothetical protein [Pseudomonas sp. NPDC087626]|uniref:hypothetical protein n=1 Tax=Pseudomonas sp. NPDC087626 TaxID=3364444 RepID=UPI00382E4DD9